MVSSRMNMGGPGRKRGPYARRGEPQDDKVQKTLRIPRSIYDAIERRALADTKAFQNYVIEILTQAMVEADPLPAESPNPSASVAPKLPETTKTARSVSELAERFQVTPRTVQNWAHERSFPRAVDKKGKALLYDEGDVLAWAWETKEIRVTAEGVFRGIGESTSRATGEGPPPAGAGLAESLAPVTNISDLASELSALKKQIATLTEMHNRPPRISEA